MKDQAGFSMPWLGKFVRCVPRRSVARRVSLILTLGLAAGLFSHPAGAAWGPPYQQRSLAAPPSQDWLKDAPERPGAAKHKVAVFVIQGDDVYQPVRAAVVRALRRQGLTVTATLQPVDSPAQYREMSSTLKVGAYVEGDVTGEGARQSVHIRVRSGVTGQHVAAASFSGPTPKIAGVITRTLWTRVGRATMRACSSAAHSHRREREPLRIEAGTPLDDASISARGT